MRTAQFKVPTEVMPDFTKELIKSELEHELTGVTKKGKIIIEVSYSRDEDQAVNDLEEYLENLLEDDNEEEDYQDEDED